ncbi:MAG: UPF0147 family protein [Thermoplasmata archaeon]|nr:UPF0147 family protein [Thermoplasmata archaeon]RLF50369.1 MAG: hypothetical protein DRN11_04785 [Thermoplasmata archaeon]HDN95951.1 UPF0147 family protein [Thermoplasmatales archaeon]
MKMKEEGLKKVCRMLEELSEDISVPRNIRRGAREARELLMKEGESLDVRVASAISLLDELLNDPNIPTHGRTAIWNIMSALESLTASE